MSVAFVLFSVLLGGVLFSQYQTLHSEANKDFYQLTKARVSWTDYTDLSFVDKTPAYKEMGLTDDEIKARFAFSEDPEQRSLARWLQIQRIHEATPHSFGKEMYLACLTCKSALCNRGPQYYVIFLISVLLTLNPRQRYWFVRPAIAVLLAVSLTYYLALIGRAIETSIIAAILPLCFFLLCRPIASTRWCIPRWLGGLLFAAGVFSVYCYYIPLNRFWESRQEPSIYQEMREHPERIYMYAVDYRHKDVIVPQHYLNYTAEYSQFPIYWLGGWINTFPDMQQWLADKGLIQPYRQLDDERIRFFFDPVSGEDTRTYVFKHFADYTNHHYHIKLNFELEKKLADGTLLYRAVLDTRENGSSTERSN